MNNELKKIDMLALISFGLKYEYAIKLCQLSRKVVLETVSDHHFEGYCKKTSEQILMAIKNIEIENEQKLIQIELVEARLERDL